MLPNASILHGRIDNALFCRTLSFGLARISLCFLGEKKTKTQKMSHFGCVFCQTLARIFPHSILQTDWLLHRLNKESLFCHILIIFLSPKFLRRFNLRCRFRAKSEKMCGLRHRNYCDQFLLCTRTMHFCESCRKNFDEKGTKSQYLKSRPEKSITWKELLWKSKPVLAILTTKSGWRPQKVLAA